MNKFTYGKTPAAVYLVDYISKLNKPNVSKRIGKILTGWRNTFSELAYSNIAGDLSAHNLAKVFALMREGFYVDVGDKKASELVTNILIGEMKMIIRKSAEIRKIELCQDKLQRKSSVGKVKTKSGYLVAEDRKNEVNFPSYTISQIRDNINHETLTEKWKKKMVKRNNENLLYKV